MSNGGSPHNQTIRENTPKPNETKVTPPKAEKQAVAQSGPVEKNKAVPPNESARA
ncbi:hypothetical protein RAS2_18650 [Phycisphaerae bacterium RAS2]|nr:hypothetical protein RAS2_18650 [Phycisphaerae bacterium RAS2]